METRPPTAPAPPRAAGEGGAPAASGWVAFSAVAVGTLMATLDGNIVNVALPTLGVELGARVDALQWIVNGYLLAITATLVLAGRLADRLGHRAVYTAGLLVFTLGSALCGAAPGLGALVGARVVQALGASAMMAIGAAVVTASFPAAMRGRALGSIGTVVAVGLTLGPPIGGLILSHLSWRWIFYVNLPVGIAGALWAWRVLPRGGLAGGPLLDLRLFRIPAFSWGLLAGFLSYAAMFSQTFLTPFLLARVLHLEPGRLGLVLAAVPIALSFSSPLAGWIADRFGGRGLPAIGMLLLAGALATLSLAGEGVTVASVAAHLALAGIGMGLFQAPNNATVMSALPRGRLGSGGGLLATSRNAGMAAGVAVAGALFALRAGKEASGAEFLEGYALALRAGALLALAAAAAVALAWRGLRGEPRRGRRAALLALRAGSALLALFLLVEPAVELLQTARVRNRFAILVDASRSMGFPVEPDGPTRSAAAGALLAGAGAALEALADRVDVEWYAFGGDVSAADPVEVAKGLPPRAGETDLLGALQAVASGAGGSSRRLAGALVVSDGADNAALAEGLGAEGRAQLRALGVPVNAVALGRSAPRDLAVERVAVDDFAFVRNTVTVEATLRARGFEGEEVRVLLRREGTVVASTTVKLERGRDRYAVPLSFAPDATGTFVFTVAAPVLPGEAIAENNTRSFVLRVIRDRVRVLLVAGRPSWDVRFLRGLLKQDPNVDLVSFFILRSNADDPGPQHELSLIPFPVQEIFGEQLRTFDAVVFQNFAYAPYRGLEIERFLPNLRDYVRGGGALAMLGGEQSFGDGRYGATPLAEVLPVAPVDGTTLAEAEVRPRLTSEGRRHPVTNLAPGDAPNESAWGALPAVGTVNLTRPLPAGSGAAVLLEAPGVLVQGRPAPLVAVREVGEGRTLAVATDGSWRWGFLAAEGGQGNRAYLRFWNSALRWLVRDPGLAPLQVEPDAPAVEPGAPVGVSVEARAPDWGPAAGRRVTAELVSEDGRAVSRAEGVADDDGNVRLSLVPPGPGAYKIVARGGDGDETATAAVAVRGAGPEDADAAPRPDLLSAIAEATGGRFSALPGGGVPELRIADPEVVEIGRRKAVPIWDRWWLLAALAATLGGEWILRRRWGYA